MMDSTAVTAATRARRRVCDLMLRTPSQSRIACGPDESLEAPSTTERHPAAYDP
jgi:hypothetical protein